MEAFFWAALAFLVLSAAGGGAFLGVRGWRAWQAFVSLAAGASAGLERLADRADRLSAHADGASARAEELGEAVARLQGSLRRAGVLTAAVTEMRETVRAVLAFVPR